MAKKKKVPTSGAMGMSARGKKVVQVWLTLEQYADLERAAHVEDRPMTQTLVRAGMEGIKKILRKADSSIDAT